MTQLFLIAAQYRDMAVKLADLDLDDQTIVDTLEGESGALVEKSQNVAFVVRNLEASAEAIKAAEGAMADRRKAVEKRAERIRAYLLDAMRVAGIQKIDSPYFAISIKKNPPAVDVFDEAQVPTEYRKEPPPAPPPAPDKKRIAEAIKGGTEVAGCRLVQGERVDIK